jgi:hypothetical protein
VHRSVAFGAALALASALMGPLRADPVLQLRTTFEDPAVCGNQFDTANPNVAAHTYVNVATDVNYQIEAGDYLEYDVLIPAESTLAAGAVDLNLSAQPRVASSGATLRDTFVAIDQWGLFAHPASNYATLSTRTTQVCGADGQAQNVPVFQRGQWFERRIDLSPLRVDAEGNPISITSVMLALDQHNTTMGQDVCPDPQNPTAIALFREINIKNRDATGKEVVKRAIWNGEAKLPNGEATIDFTGERATAQVSVIDFTPATNPSTPGNNTGNTGNTGTDAGNNTGNNNGGTDNNGNAGNDGTNNNTGGTGGTGSNP